MKTIPVFFKSLAIVLFAYAPFCSQAQENLYGNEFNLSDVKLLSSPFKHAMELNADVLLQYDADRLMAPFFKEAGLKPKAELFPNWAGLDGHVGGHYLSALAIHYAATGDERLKERLDYCLAQLALCAAERGDGYIGGVPDSDVVWTEVKRGNVGKIYEWWVPWYNVHKVMAGLRDAWLYTGSRAALNLFLGTCDWTLNEIASLSDQQMESMLGQEHGGVNEVLADAYAITGDMKYLDAAKRFTHHSLFDNLAADKDCLDNMHANTQVPKIVGYQRVAELTGADDYTEAAEFFWDTVVGNRSLSFGGNSRREHFPSAADAKSYVDDREGPESCNTNNMLKLSEGLFRMTRDAKYADFYERALYNHILSTQHPEHGGYVYFTSARPGHYRVYSQPNSAMWCCVGTGMENHGKYGQFIYTHTPDSLWVNLFIPSELNWKEKNLKLVQENNFPEEQSTKFTIRTEEPETFTLNLRHPGWCRKPIVKINGERLKTASVPSSYISINREWTDGDVVELLLPMEMAIEELNYLPDYVSILHGPLVMGVRYGGDTPMPGLVAGDSRWGHIASGPLVSVFDTPLLIGNRKNILQKLNALKPEKVGELHFDASAIFQNSGRPVILEPFNGIHDSRYTLYFLSMTPAQYAAYKENALRDEKARLALDKRTVDAVNTGEQQPEADHNMKATRSQSGNFNGEPWRDASSEGFFSYLMNTGGCDDLNLRVRYWGNENGIGNVVILIDGKEIAEVDNVGKWGKPAFMEEEYRLPADVLKGKDRIEVRFRTPRGKSSGGIYHVRLLQPE